MARNIPLSTIGVKVSYAVEVTAGVRPTKDYIRLYGLYSTPDFNIAPSTVDASSFDEEEFTYKLTILKEMPDSLSFGARYGAKFCTQWDAFVSAYENAANDNKGTWMCIDIKGTEKSLYIPCEPLKLGLPALEANSGININAYIAPQGEPVEEADPTYKEE